MQHPTWSPKCQLICAETRGACPNKQERGLCVKVNVNILRGYNNSHPDFRRERKNGAQSAESNEVSQQAKNRKSYFSKPDLYSLPSVYSSKKK